MGYVIGRRPNFQHMKALLLECRSRISFLEIFSTEYGFFLKFGTAVDGEKVIVQGPWRF